MTNTPGPLAPTAAAIRPNTPNGAASITNRISVSMTSEAAPRRSATGFARSPRIRTPAENTIAKKMIASISPSTMA